MIVQAIEDMLIEQGEWKDDFSVLYDEYEVMLSNEFHQKAYRQLGDSFIDSPDSYIDTYLCVADNQDGFPKILIGVNEEFWDGAGEYHEEELELDEYERQVLSEEVADALALR